MKKIILYIFLMQRHYWKNKSKKIRYNKGNDKLIYAWKKFINEHRPDAILAAFEYGILTPFLHQKKLLGT